MNRVTGDLTVHGVESPGMPWLDEVRAFDEAVTSGRLKLVFLCGMARSGTTWLTELLCQHADVASPPELVLFSHYLSGANLALQPKATAGGRSVKARMSAADVGASLRPFVFRALMAFVPNWRDKRVIVEKTPDHIHNLELVKLVVPEARFLLVVRDPRAVIASWRAGARSFQPQWRQFGTIQLARSWLNSAKAIDGFSARPDAFITQYERLSKDGVRELKAILDWLGLDATDEACATYLANCTVDAMRSRGPSRARSAGTEESRRAWRPGFIRKGSVDGWRKDLTRAQVRRIEHIAAKAMERFGYALSLPPRRVEPSVTYYDLMRRLDNFTGRVLRKLRRL